MIEQKLKSIRNDVRQFNIEKHYIDKFIDLTNEIYPVYCKEIETYEHQVKFLNDVIERLRRIVVHPSPHLICSNLSYHNDKFTCSKERTVNSMLIATSDLLNLIEKEEPFSIADFKLGLKSLLIALSNKG